MVKGDCNVARRASSMPIVVDCVKKTVSPSALATGEDAEDAGALSSGSGTAAAPLPMRSGTWTMELGSADLTNHRSEPAR